MNEMEASPIPIIDIKNLSLDRGAHLLINRALLDIPVGAKLGVSGCAPELAVHLRSWCRAQGHAIIWNEAQPSGQRSDSRDSSLIAWIVRGKALAGRWQNAEQAGLADCKISG